MRTLIIQFESSHYRGPLTNNASVKVGDDGVIQQITFNGSVRQFTGEQWEKLKQDIESCLQSSKPEMVMPVSNLPAQKMSLGASIKHVFGKSNDGRGIFDKLGDIQKMAEHEMTEEEKKDSQVIMEKMKKLFSK